MKTLTMSYPGETPASLDCYLLDCELKFGQNTDRPAIVICPGGGYIYLSPRESEPVALAYAAKGFHTFILHYSVGRDAVGWTPLAQIDWAIGTIREHAAEWHIDPEKIVSCGFSAGGHLALASGLRAKNRPNAMILGYPATSFGPAGPENMILQLISGQKELTEEQAVIYDLTPQVNAQTPPAYIFTTYGDSLTRSPTLALAARYDALNIPFEYHMFGFGPHGYSLADEVAADGSSQVLDAHAAKWLDLSAEWLIRLFGGLEFRDVSTSRIGEALKKLGLGADMSGAEHS